MASLRQLPAVGRDDVRVAVALFVLLAGLVVGLAVRRVVRGSLSAAGVPEAVEGTSFDRTARRLGTTTVGLFAEMSAWFVYGLAVLVALRVAHLLPIEVFWARLTGFVPNLFLAALALGVGFVVGDKAQLTVSEHLRGVKLPEISVLPRAVKYSVIYVAALVALRQVGVATGALVLLFGVYAAGVLLFAGLALRDILPAGAAGIYLLLNQPYSIGDTIAVDGHRGVVQEIDVFVTLVEDDGSQYVIPNHLVLRSGVVRELD
ncbi:MAG: mechanosensitive ion channel domain-containing protein [Halobacteriaceae archaeon]